VQYYILTRSEYFKEVVEWLELHNIAVDIHLNRTRFTVPDNSKLFTEFMLRYSTVCHAVDASLDLATGLPLST
jgi:hypothetical protein